MKRQLVQICSCIILSAPFAALRARSQADQTPLLISPASKEDRTAQYRPHDRLLAGMVMASTSSDCPECGADLILCLKDGDAWISKSGRYLGIYTSQTGSWKFYGGEAPEALAEGANGVVFAIRNGRAKFFDGRWHDAKLPPPTKAMEQHFALSHAFLGDLSEPRGLFSANDGRVFFIRDDALVAFDHGKWSVLAAPDPTVEKYASLPLPVAQGEIQATRWDISTRRLRLALKITHDPIQLVEPSGPMSEAYCGLADQQGGIWLATDRAVIRINPEYYKWDIHPLPAGLVQAQTCFMSRAGHLWVSDRFGNIASFDPGSEIWKVWNIELSIAAGDISETEKIPPPPGWDESSADRFRQSVPPNQQQIVSWDQFAARSIGEDKLNRLLLGTRRGLVVADLPGRSWRLFNSTNSILPKDTLGVCAIAGDGLGRIWLGLSSHLFTLDRDPPGRSNK